MADLKVKPEEEVRSSLVEKMTGSLGFPRELIVIEKGLAKLPHLMDRDGLPNRRLDILCYGRDIHPDHVLYPLLIIECKATPLDFQAARQVIGYNHYVSAYFIGIANCDRVMIGWKDKKSAGYHFQEGLMSYGDLLEQLLKDSPWKRS